MTKQTSLSAKKEDRLGTVQGHRDGFGFVIPDDGKEDKDRKSTRLNSSHTDISRMPSSA